MKENAGLSDMLSGLHLPPHLSFRGIYEGVKQGLRERAAPHIVRIQTGDTEIISG